mmetsp:Transcript_30037/g.82446  ORF Transcript_30037/g.82446 Transcript_30037/m.82446 type:complete len:243 (+) Transcript_30037:683-1411(+)
MTGGGNPAESLASPPALPAPLSFAIASDSLANLSTSATNTLWSLSIFVTLTTFFFSVTSRTFAFRITFRYLPICLCDDFLTSRVVPSGLRGFICFSYKSEASTGNVMEPEKAWTKQKSNKSSCDQSSGALVAFEPASAPAKFGTTVGEPDEGAAFGLSTLRSGAAEEEAPLAAAVGEAAEGEAVAPPAQPPGTQVASEQPVISSSFSEKPAFGIAFPAYSHRVSLKTWATSKPLPLSFSICV